MDAKGRLLTFISNGIEFKSKIDYGDVFGAHKLNVVETLVSIKKYFFVLFFWGVNKYLEFLKRHYTTIVK
jgi:hypothetical protein